MPSPDFWLWGVGHKREKGCHRALEVQAGGARSRCAVLWHTAEPAMCSHRHCRPGWEGRPSQRKQAPPFSIAAGTGRLNFLLGKIKALPREPRMVEAPARVVGCQGWAGPPADAFVLGRSGSIALAEARPSRRPERPGVSAPCGVTIPAAGRPRDGPRAITSATPAASVRAGASMASCHSMADDLGGAALAPLSSL